MSIRNNFDPSVAGFLKSWRLSEGMSQKEFAGKIGISAANLCDIEKGRKGISSERAYYIGIKIGYPPEVLVRIAIQDQLKTLGLKFKVELKKVA
jgi:transcriptional regulator with XRE-family HTH domain